MSDDIFSIATPFPDVASLAQGYMNRADGERLLLPLPSPCEQGEGARFVVCLADGTPAFAGAGLCSQVSDQGGSVPPEQRFETLLDTLELDERSRPVYDYIVAVRNAAYAEHAQAGQVDAEVDASIGEVEVLASSADVYEEPSSLHPDAPSAIPGSDSASFAPSPEPARVPSFVPPPIPTGLLTRPARTTHWQPAPPRRPTPRPASGLFRYGASGLPRPNRPPRPDLDPAQWVHPAPRL
jgi:hypothetical protein